jgi:hypothetical protein
MVKQQTLQAERFGPFFLSCHSLPFILGSEHCSSICIFFVQMMTSFGENDKPLSLKHMVHLSLHHLTCKRASKGALNQGVITGEGIYMTYTNSFITKSQYQRLQSFLSASNRCKPISSASPPHFIFLFTTIL